MLALRRLVPVAVALACLSLPLVAAAKKPIVPLAKQYTVVMLTLGGTQCRVLAMNDGAAVGSAQTPGDAETHAFLWTQASGMVDLGTLGGTLALARWYDNGRVVGVSSTANDEEFHAFLWTAATGMQDLGTLGGPYGDASRIDGNRIIGQSLPTAESEFVHAFVWTQAAGMVDLGTLPGAQESGPRGASQGLIAGASSTSVSRSRRPVVWLPDNQIVDITGLPYELDENGILIGSGETQDVRDGLVVGFRFRSELVGTPVHAFTWTQATGEIDLGVPAGFSESAAFATDGSLVGGQLNRAPPDFGIRPMVWSSSNGMFAIGPDTIDGQVTHIHTGRVIGFFSARDGSTNGPRAFLWTESDGMLDVTPASFTRGARSAGIDAQGRIAIVDDEEDIGVVVSAVLIPKKP